jgi:hypothetical protein
MLSPQLLELLRAWWREGRSLAYTAANPSRRRCPTGRKNLPKPAIAENARGSGLPRSNLRKLQIAVTGPSQDDGRCDENPAVPPCRTEVHSITPGQCHL